MLWRTNNNNSHKKQQLNFCYQVQDVLHLSKPLTESNLSMTVPLYVHWSLKTSWVLFTIQVWCLYICSLSNTSKMKSNHQIILGFFLLTHSTPEVWYFIQCLTFGLPVIFYQNQWRFYFLIVKWSDLFNKFKEDLNLNW
jgi:hypothetical protein